MDTSAPPPKALEPPPREITDDLSPQVQFVMNQDWEWIVDWEWHRKLTPYNKGLNDTCAGCLKKTYLKKKDLVKAIEHARFTTPLLPPTMSVEDKLECHL